MATLLLKLSGPLQSWGSDSRFTERKTRPEPTKSGVLGLLASALGRRRTEDISDLAALRYGVRVDQAGKLERDYQTAHTKKYNPKTGLWEFKETMPLSNRYYLADAIFVAALEGGAALLRQCAEALDVPSFPLYLGRRSCPPGERIFLSYSDDCTLMEALSSEPWFARNREARRITKQLVQLQVLRDPIEIDTGNELRETLRDVPISFSQERRDYSSRTVVHDFVAVPNPYALPEHDPMAAIEGVQK